MPKKAPLGLMTCPECDFPDAEVHNDRNGHKYRWCPECGTQVFTRGDPARTKNMEKKMRAAPPQEPATAAPGAPKPPPPPEAAPKVPPVEPGAPGEAAGTKPPPLKPRNPFFLKR